MLPARGARENGKHAGITLVVSFKAGQPSTCFAFSAELTQIGVIMPDKQPTVGQRICLNADIQHLKAGTTGTVRDIYPDGAYIVVNGELIFVNWSFLDPLQ